MSNTSKDLEKIKKKYLKKNKKKKLFSYFGCQMDPKGFHPSQIKFFLILIPLLIIMVLPICFIVSHAFKPIEELFAYPPKFFASRLTFDNFANLFEATSQTNIDISRYIFNSLIVTVAVIILSIIFSSTAAFSFTFLEFKGKKFLFAANQFAIMFIAVAVAVPRFMVISGLGLSNNYLSHIVPLLAMPVGVFLLRQFMGQIPKDLIEAAYIDGANKFHIYSRIIMPLIKPALATIAILSFQAAWNNTETSMMYVIDESLYTLPYYFQTLTLGTSAVVATGIQAATSLILFLPNIIIFVILQGNVMNTMAHSGIK